MKSVKLLCLACSALAFSAFAAPQVVPDNSGIDAALTQALKGTWRSSAHAARDQYRHPRETLEFFSLRPDMTVVELWPGNGWYTEILAPVLKEHGHLIAAATPVSLDTPTESTQAYLDMLAANKAAFGNVKEVDFLPPSKMGLGPVGSADLVLTFRNLHNWQGNGEVGD